MLLQRGKEQRSSVLLYCVYFHVNHTWSVWICWETNMLLVYLQLASKFNLRSKWDICKMYHRLLCLTHCVLCISQPSFMLSLGLSRGPSPPFWFADSVHLHGFKYQLTKLVQLVYKIRIRIFLVRVVQSHVSLGNYMYLILDLCQVFGCFKFFACCLPFSQLCSKRGWIANLCGSDVILCFL